MTDTTDLLQDILRELSEISSTLHEISGKLDSLSSVYGIDDLVSKLDEVVVDITGKGGYNLTDLFTELSQINDKTGT